MLGLQKSYGRATGPKAAIARLLGMFSVAVSRFREIALKEKVCLVFYLFILVILRQFPEGREKVVNIGIRQSCGLSRGPTQDQDTYLL